MLSLSPTNQRDEKLEAIATLSFSDYGRGGDPLVDLNGDLIYLDKNAKVQASKQELKTFTKDLDDKSLTNPATGRSFIINTNAACSEGDPHGYVFQMPIVKQPKEGEKLFRQTLYIAGPSDSGKSTYVAKYVRLWKHLRSQLGLPCEVFIFSRVKIDYAFEKIGGMKNIIINEELLEDPIEDEEVEQSLVIFDDIDTIEVKELREYIVKFRDHLLKTGAHLGTYVISTSHQILDWTVTRVPINEAQFITVFPGAHKEAIFNFLRKQMGVSNEKSRFIVDDLGAKSRWITLYKNYPPYIIHENGVTLL